tara:strand:- start:286 stop:2748 length:2463 start_codon:yes stop_codon:yes gene_type:complete
MPTPTIPNGEEHFFPIIYEGNGAGQRVGKFVPFTDNGTIANSCIFDSASNAYLSRTPASAGNRKTFTISFWVKRGRLGDQAGSNTYGQRIFHAADSSSAFFDIKWSGTGDTEGANRLHIREYSSSAEQIQYWTNRRFTDTTKWYHILLAIDTTQSTSGDRIKLYVDGDQITSWYRSNAPSLNLDTLVNSTVAQHIGRFVGATSNNLDAYLAEFNLVDGTALTPDTFGLTDTSTGRWIPKALTGITYGTNGFRLQFGSTSNLGDDTSGNTNDFSVSNLVAGDQTTDSPTQNHATLSSSRTRGSLTLSEGNLKMTCTSTNYGASATTLKFSEQTSQGFYFEVKNAGSAQDAMSVLIMRNSVAVSGLGSNQQFTDCFGLMSRGGGGSNQYWLSNNGSNDVTTGVSHASNDYIQVAFKDGKVWYGINNTWIFSGNPATGANPTYDNISGQDFRFLMTGYNNHILECNFGQKSFNYTPPTGFVAVQQDNLPETAKGVSGLTWTKDRDATASWMCIDSSRTYAAEGVPAAINLDNTNKEYGQNDFVDGINKFLKGGFAVATSNNTYSYMNKSGNSNVSYCWVANGGTTSSITTGTINTVVQANTTAGFSIVKYTGIGSSGAGYHGLSSAPEWMIFKDRENDSTNWRCYHKSLGITQYLSLNVNTQAQSASMWGAPTASAFIIGGTGYEVNESGRDYIAYCWHPVEGYSKFGKYSGNGNDDGPFIYLGFRPAFIIIKRYAGGDSDWMCADSKRWSFNRGSGASSSTNISIFNSTGAEVTNYANIDFLSNGFKIRSQPSANGSSSTYIYCAWAEHPFVGDGTNPVTAR